MKKLLLLVLSTLWIGASIYAQCPTSVTATANVSEVCSGENIKLSASVNQGEATYTWTTEVGSPVPSPENWLIVNKSCRGIVQTFIVTATCVANPSVQLTSQVSITTYPDAIDTYITPLPGGCNATVSVDPACAGSVQAGSFTAEQGQSGTAQIYVDWIGGGNCLQDFFVDVNYDCATGGGGGSGTGGGNSGAGNNNADPTVALDDNIGVYTQGAAADFTGDFLLSNDLGDNLEIVEVCSTSANGGTIVSNGNGTYTYTPNPNFTGLDSFCYSIIGADGNTSSATIFVFYNTNGGGGVDAVNDDLGTHDVGESVTFTTGFLLGNDFGDGIFISNVCVNSVNGGTITDNGNGTYTYTPPSANYTGTDSFCYSINSTSGQTDSATIFVTLVGGQIDLIALNDNIGTHNAGASVTFSSEFLLNNDTGIGIGILNICSPSDAGGTVTDNGDGTYTYSPPSADYTGTDAFCYTISDVNGNVVEATVFVTFVEDGAVVNANDDNLGSFNSGENTVFTSTQLLGNDTGENIIVLSVCTTTTAGGTITDNGDGTYTYTPPFEGFTGTDSFCYTITDSFGNTDEATITVTFIQSSNIQAINDDLGAYAVGEFVTFTAGQILANDIGAGIFVVSVCSPSNQGGTVIDNGNGTYTYAPPAPFGLSPGEADSFCYTIQDASGNTDEATVILSYVDVKFTADVSPVCNEEEGTFMLVVNVESEFSDFIVEVIQPAPLAPVGTIFNFAELGPFQGGTNVPYLIRVTQESTGATRLLVGSVTDCASNISFEAEEVIICNSGEGTFSLVVTIQGDTGAEYEIDVVAPAGQAPIVTTENVTELGPFETGENVPYLIHIRQTNGGGTLTLEGLVLDCVTLPVELLNFEGEVQEKGNLLSWVTATEVNNDYFILERSEDGVFFQSIAVVDGNGNSPDMHLYTYIDKETPSGVSYYRLLQVDFDGTTRIMGIVSLKRSEVAFNILQVVPVGNYSEYNVGFTSDDYNPISVQIFNTAGQAVYNETVTPIEGLNYLSVDLNPYTQGMYLLRLQQGNVFKVVKLMR